MDKKFRHFIDVVVDRIVVREGIEARLADSFRTALDLADGIAVLETAPTDEEAERHTFSENFSCPESGFTISEIEPRLFSFNAPFGACPDCDGLGVELFFDERLVVPDQTLKIRDGALAPWRKGKSPYFLQTIEAIANHYGFAADARWKDNRSSFMDPAMKKLIFAMMKVVGFIKLNACLRELSQTWNVGTAKQIVTGCVKSLKIIKIIARVEAVGDIGCGPKPWL